VARVELAPEVADDFECTLEHPERHEVEDALARVDDILAAIDVLETNLRIGCPAGDDRRELIMGRESHGYIALYRYVTEIDTVFVLAIRSQRGAGYGQGVGE
jgi:plasmid stabilization system protein ParE